MRAHDMQCDEIALLLQAEVDGELDAAQAATVVHHREHCTHCASIYHRLLTLREKLRAELRHQLPSEEFQAALRVRLNSVATDMPFQEERKQLSRRRGWTMFGAGAVLAAALTFIFIAPNESSLADTAVTEHIRSLQAEHLLDVVSTDQHTVKPWFNGKLDFAPPVKDLTESGFPLAGGRLDYLAGRAVAALIYYRGRHPINLFIWPNIKGRTESLPHCMQRVGYHLCVWSSADMNYWAVSDLNEAELNQFANHWQR